MEEYQARKQPPSDYQISYNLAHQPYSLPEPDDVPLEEEVNVVPMTVKPRAGQVPPGSLDRMAEEPLSPRSTGKRKQSGTSKGRSTAGKAKPSKTYRAPQAAKQQPFADELQHLEELAERINHILAERARKKAYIEQSQAMQSQAIRQSSRSPMAQPPNYGQPSLEEQDTENLKLQAKRIRHRLSQLEVMMDAADAAEPSEFGTAPEHFEYYQPPQPSRSPQPPSAAYQPPYSPQPASFDPVRQRGEYEAWRAAEELRQLKEQEQPYIREERRDRSAPAPSFAPFVRQTLSRLRRLPVGGFLQLPRKPMDGLSDGVMWIAIAAIARIASRYVLAVFPVLSPVVTLLMLAPAGLAIFLALFMPKTGWIPFYRLFLIMLGLFIGGKFF